jgi:hypothetical protein
LSVLVRIVGPCQDCRSWSGLSVLVRIVGPCQDYWSLPGLSVFARIVGPGQDCRFCLVSHHVKIVKSCQESDIVRIVGISQDSRILSLMIVGPCQDCRTLSVFSVLVRIVWPCQDCFSLSGLSIHAEIACLCQDCSSMWNAGCREPAAGRHNARHQPQTGHVAIVELESSPKDVFMLIADARARLSAECHCYACNIVNTVNPHRSLRNSLVYFRKSRI